VSASNDNYDWTAGTELDVDPVADEAGLEKQRADEVQNARFEVMQDLAAFAARSDENKAVAGKVLEDFPFTAKGDDLDKYLPAEGDLERDPATVRSDIDSIRDEFARIEPAYETNAKEAAERAELNKNLYEMGERGLAQEMAEQDRLSASQERSERFASLEQKERLDDPELREAALVLANTQAEIDKRHAPGSDANEQARTMAEAQIVERLGEGAVFNSEQVKAAEQQQTPHKEIDRDQALEM